jgi:hypothetical protein
VLGLIKAILARRGIIAHDGLTSPLRPMTSDEIDTLVPPLLESAVGAGA